MTDRRFGQPSSAEFRETRPDQKIADQLIIDTWSTSREREIYMQRRLSIVLAAIGAVGLATFGWKLIRPEGRSSSQWWGTAVLGLAAVMLLWCLMPYWASRRAYLQRKRATAAARVDQAVRDIASRPDLPLTMLFELNRRQLDEYQEMTKKQQRSAFLLQIASVVAFLALVVGIGLSLQDNPGTGKYVVAGLSGLGALLSAFLANTFYQSHRDANNQLNRYYLEPQRTGRILAAERLARYLNEEPGMAHTNRMIEALLSWEMPAGELAAKNGDAPDAPKVKEPEGASGESA